MKTQASNKENTLSKNQDQKTFDDEQYDLMGIVSVVDHEVQNIQNQNYSLKHADKLQMF